MSEIFPTELKRTDDRKLVIVWSDGQQQTIPYRTIRNACPCATCMNEATEEKDQPVGALPVLTAAQARPLEIEVMNPVGNYAYNIQFSDGHSTGIFTFEMLRRIAAESA